MRVVVRLWLLPKGDYSNAKDDVVQPCGMSKGEDIMSFLTSFNHVFYPRTMITFLDNVCFIKAMNAIHA